MLPVALAVTDHASAAAYLDARHTALRAELDALLTQADAALDAAAVTGDLGAARQIVAAVRATQDQLDTIEAAWTR